MNKIRPVSNIGKILGLARAGYIVHICSLEQARAGLSLLACPPPARDGLKQAALSLSLLRKQELKGMRPMPEIRAYGYYRYLGWQAIGQKDEQGDEILEYRKHLC